MHSSLLVFVLAVISMSVPLWSNVKDIYALPAPIFGPLDHSYDLTIDGKSYTLRYGFSDDKSVRLESMIADSSAKTITVKIDDTNPDHVADKSVIDWQKRLFLIELPRNIIDSNTTEIAGGCNAPYTAGSQPAWVQEHDIDYNISASSILDNNTINTFSGHLGGDLCGQDSRTLSVSYPYGRSIIVIQGTAMIPEFGTELSALVMAAAVAGIIATGIAVKYRAF